jgi:hypothetical protein
MSNHPIWDDEGCTNYKQKIDRLALKISWLDFKLFLVMIYIFAHTMMFFVVAMYINELEQEAHKDKGI